MSNGEVIFEVFLTEAAGRVCRALLGQTDRFSFSSFRPTGVLIPGIGDEVAIPGQSGLAIFTIINRRFQWEGGDGPQTITYWLDASEDQLGPITAT